METLHVKDMSATQKFKKSWIKDPVKYILLWFFALSIFLLGHFLFVGWDFSSYVLNAQFLFGQGNFFEIYRAPLMSVILGMFSLFDWKVAEYAYIIFTACLFFYSSLRLARSIESDRFLFSLFSLNAFVLLFGLVEGTELLALALLQLFLAFLLEDKWYAGFFLGLACLTRYPLVVLFPLLLFHKQWRNWIWGAMSFTLAFIPWFVYNHIHYGNIFYSIADSYAMNILYRDYLITSFNWSYLLFAGNILLPFAILGLILFLWKKDFSRKNLLFFIFLIFALYSISTQKVDVLRYYITLTIPIVFFSVYSFHSFSPDRRRIFLGVIVTVSLLFLLYGMIDHQKEHFKGVAEQVHTLIGDCALKSNVWVPLTYYGTLSEPQPQEKMLWHDIEEGYYVLFFYSAREPDYMLNESFILSFPVVVQTKEYILLGNGCLAQEPVTKSYLQQLNAYLFFVDNYTVSDDPCEILFDGSKVCTSVNNIVAVGS
ncbi:DUF2029 domain-containing protein [Candidatus Woesearchaeota archaeon]|nr:DUF2029 domain-containing protein [Candidatus Woesearchaeota archaeon]